MLSNDHHSSLYWAFRLLCWSRVPFYKMIVPTVDTIRYEYLISQLLLNQCPVLLVGAVGTGKTIVAEKVLHQLDLEVYNTLIVHMSAQVHRSSQCFSHDGEIFRQHRRCCKRSSNPISRSARRMCSFRSMERKWLHSSTIWTCRQK